jgi:hypothetical protein
MNVLQTYLLALLAALYLFRGMLEFPVIGWRPELRLSVGIGLGLLPVLAALSASHTVWGQWAIGILSVIGIVVNSALLVRLWSGLTNVAATTIVICVGYMVVVASIFL